MTRREALAATVGGLAAATGRAAARAVDKADIDTSPRVFASADGKYWVRVTTARGPGNAWDTKLVPSHADGGRGTPTTRSSRRRSSTSSPPGCW